MKVQANELTENKLTENKLKDVNLKKIKLSWVRSVLRFAVAGLLVSAASAGAVVINFDDRQYIPSDPEFPCFCDMPLTNEYEHHGLIIDGGFLSELAPPDGDGFHNGLLSSDLMTLNFVGALPVFISMYVSAPSQDAIYLFASGNNGYSEQKKTSGYGGPDDDTPYSGNQPITFTAPDGISSITVQGYYGLRVEALIDDINCEYDVPEPASLALLGLGIFGLALRRLRRDV